MFQAITIGFTTGFLLSLTFGTVFFALVQSSIDNGYRSGIKIAFGVLISDAILILIALFGTSFLPDVPNAKNIISAVGGSILVILGLTNVIRHSPKVMYPQTRMGNILYYVGKGFLLNILNPINFFSWVTVTAYVRGGLQMTGFVMYTFFFFSQLGILFAETLLSVFAHRLKRVINERTINLINKVTGGVFLVVGLRLLISIWL